MREAISTLWPYLWRYRRGLSLGLGALILKDAMAAVMPIILKYGVDTLTAGFRLAFILELAGLLIGVSLVKGIFQYWMRVIIIGISRDIEYDIRNDFFRKLVSLSQDFYARYRTGDIMARATNDLNAVRMMLGPGVMYWTETSITLVLALIVMLSTNVSMTLISLIPAPIVSVAVVLFGRQIHTRFEHIQSMFSDISSKVQENLAGVRIVRAYAQENAEVAQFEKLNREYIRENIGLAKIQGMFMPALQGLIGITFLLVLWAGGVRLLRHEISLGSFVMFNTYMGMLVDGRERHLARAAIALAFFHHHVLQVFRMHIQQTRTGFGDGFHDIHARSCGMADIDAEPAAGIHVFDDRQSILRPREVLVFGPVVVNRDLDVVFFDEFAELRQNVAFRHYNH
jgi:ATP-binding cassette subfamily B protein